MSSVQYCHNLKKYHPSDIKLFGRFPKLKIAYFNGKNPFDFSLAEFHSKYLGLLWVSEVIEVITLERDSTFRKAFRLRKRKFQESFSNRT